MSDVTKIEWTDHTWSPWEGCTKVSPGCANCYAEARNHRWGKDNWGKGHPRRLTVDWKKPLRWNAECSATYVAAGFSLRSAQAEACGYNRKSVFPSLCDPFDDEVPIQWLADFLKLIHETPNLDWLLLTKRPEKAEQRINSALKLIEVGSSMWTLGGLVPHNVWLGVSVEDQRRADERIPELLKIPAALRFLSVEPLLAPVDLSGCLPDEPDSTWRRNSDGTGDAFADWVIIGGESGAGARPCNIEWIRDLARQCREAAVPAFVKQLGSAPVMPCQPDGADGVAKLKHSKGGDPAEWPEDLRVREFPKQLSRDETTVTKE